MYFFDSYASICGIIIWDKFSIHFFFLSPSVPCPIGSNDCSTEYPNSPSPVRRTTVLRSPLLCQPSFDFETRLPPNTGSKDLQHNIPPSRHTLTSNDLKRFPPHHHEVTTTTTTTTAAKETAKLLTVLTSESVVVAANPVNTRSQALSTNFGKFPPITSGTNTTSPRHPSRSAFDGARNPYVVSVFLLRFWNGEKVRKIEMIVVSQACCFTHYIIGWFVLRTPLWYIFLPTSKLFSIL